MRKIPAGSTSTCSPPRCERTRSELGTFVEALAVKLEEAVPGSVRVQRRRDGLFGPKLVRRIALDAGDRAARAVP